MNEDIRAKNSIWGHRIAWNNLHFYRKIIFSNHNFVFSADKSETISTRDIIDETLFIINLQQYFQHLIMELQSALLYVLHPSSKYGEKKKPSTNDTERSRRQICIENWIGNGREWVRENIWFWFLCNFKQFEKCLPHSRRTISSSFDESKRFENLKQIP